MYEVKRIDLGTVADSVTIVPPNRRIGEVFMLDIPADTSFKIKLGDNSDFITIARPFSMEPTDEKETNNGLYVSVPVAYPGLFAELVVVYGSKTSDGLNTLAL